MMEEVKYIAMNYEDIAMLCHNINKAYCEAIGDNSQPKWCDAPAWQRESAIKGVNFHLQTKDVTPEMSHESWLAEKTADGWSYGEVKDADKKEHPCFLPYSKLPQEQRVKDYLFKAAIESVRHLIKEETKNGEN